MSEQFGSSCKLPLIAVTVHPSKYNGTQDPESWLQDLRFFCRLHGIEEESEIVSFAILKVDPMISIPKNTCTFSGFLNALKSHITFPVMSASALHTLRCIKYNANIDMTDFISNFLSLCRSANITSLEEQKTYLLNSLQDDNIRNILASKFRSIDDFEWVIKLFQGIMYEYPMHQIRYGSKITIKHCVSGQYLTHGEHEPIEPDSKLSTVFCNGSKPATNEVWIVTSPFGENKTPGDPVLLNSVVGLRHETTGSNLHAADHPGRDESGYHNEQNGVWAIGDIIILENVNNKLPLYSNGDDINHGVVLGGDGYEENNKWYAEIAGQ
ncbi:559_t:CDS:2 [Funneliformis mosseae]|uniref:559_t:CDS:1 n=1 Tax=Funneliformis mosseae TaxID=27381 RepID=A0A9N9BUY1_FUNMO|nr:559_t:CDS:2 [Funneliformis mosseae]